jgi:hypothetical protein
MLCIFTGKVECPQTGHGGGDEWLPSEAAICAFSWRAASISARSGGSCDGRGGETLAASLQGPRQVQTVQRIVLSISRPLFRETQCPTFSRAGEASNDGGVRSRPSVDDVELGATDELVVLRHHVDYPVAGEDFGEVVLGEL